MINPSMPSNADFVSGRVVVVGSLNIDRILRVAHLPRPGETIFASGAQQAFGGKGANQAVAAARFGAAVSLIGAVGMDAEGRSYREHLVDEQVAIGWLATLSGLATGTAFISVDAHGENEIIVDRGANGVLAAAHVTAALAALLPSTDVVLVGLECPLDAAVAALRAAAAAGVRSLLNPSPIAPDFPWGEVAIDTVVVNENECAEIFGAPEPAALIGRGVRHLVVTRGGVPTLLVSATGVQSVPTYPVEPRDTVGAGDTFAGVLAARLAEGAEWGDALWRANVAAALSTLAAGAQTAMPHRAEVLAAPGLLHPL
jgi:ribokinase